jgi:hypothetical protein
VKSRDYIVDITGLHRAAPPPRDGADDAPRGTPTLRGRPWLAVHWKCCHVYSRIYRTADGLRYEGQCPRCGRRTKARVSPDGINARFFEAQ